MEVHPLAAVFPMMADDELQDLAADIKEHGLLHPIVLDADGVLIDGRNRLRACEIAGVEPLFESLNGHDAAAFIVSANLARRNLTKGQQAMAYAMIYPDPGKDKGGRGKTVLKPDGLTKQRLSLARFVLQHSRALADDVLAHRTGLDEAFSKAIKAREESQSTDAMMTELRAHAPDLADLVDEERLPLAEAHAALKKRQADAAAAEANKRETILRLSESAWHATTAWASGEFLAELTDRFADAEFRRQWLARVRPDPARIKEIMAGATALARFFTLAVGEQHNV